MTKKKGKDYDITAEEFAKLLKEVETSQTSFLATIIAWCWVLIVSVGSIALAWFTVELAIKVIFG